MAEGPYLRSSVGPVVRRIISPLRATPLRVGFFAALRMRGVLGPCRSAQLASCAPAGAQRHREARGETGVAAPVYSFVRRLRRLLRTGSSLRSG